MEFGYGRTSTQHQDLERQLLKFRELGIDERNIFTDQQSGKDFSREDYQALRRMIRKDDLIYFDALDRLGRDYDGIISEWKFITRTVGADILILENPDLFDSRKWKQMGDIGKLMEDQFLSLLAFVADQERKKMLQRQKEGIAVARANGVQFGRKKKKIDNRFKQIVERWNNKEITAVEAYTMMGMSKNTFYRRIKELETI